MQVAVLPVKSGYVAVSVGPFDGTWKIDSPKPLPEDLLIQLRAQIAQKLAQYCWEISPWMGIWFVVFLWAAWGGLALGISSLWDYGLRTALLYGWIRILFFGNGIMLLSQCLYHWRGSKRARLIRNHLLDRDWEVDAGLYIPRDTDEVFAGLSPTERQFVEFMIVEYPHLTLWYKQLLKVEKPLIFRYIPLGAVGFLRQMLLGPEIPVPPLVFDLGTLEI
jgi:hypothetical protein